MRNGGSGSNRSWASCRTSRAARGRPSHPPPLSSNSSAVKLPSFGDEGDRELEHRHAPGRIALLIHLLQQFDRPLTKTAGLHRRPPAPACTGTIRRSGSRSVHTFVNATDLRFLKPPTEPAERALRLAAAASACLPLMRSRRGCVKLMEIWHCARDELGRHTDAPLRCS
jgi:hypothetical protein